MNKAHKQTTLLKITIWFQAETPIENITPKTLRLQAPKWLPHIDDAVRGIKIKWFMLRWEYRRLWYVIDEETGCVHDEFMI